VERTVREHIEHLESLLKRLNDEAMRETDVLTRNVIEAEIRAANMALTHYRLALENEQKLSRRD
jgi:hypothetical protein